MEDHIRPGLSAYPKSSRPGWPMKRERCRIIPDPEMVWNVFTAGSQETRIKKGMNFREAESVRARRTHTREVPHSGGHYAKPTTWTNLCPQWIWNISNFHSTLSTLLLSTPSNEKLVLHLQVMRNVPFFFSQRLSRYFHGGSDID
jgi:hypothetical protein